MSQEHVGTHGLGWYLVGVVGLMRVWLLEVVEGGWVGQDAWALSSHRSTWVRMASAGIWLGWLNGLQVWLVEWVASLVG